MDEPSDRSPAVVFIAHGSRAPAANEAHVAQAAALARATGLEVHAAFLELAEPSIPEAIDAAAAAGASTVVVLPYFFYPGRHVARDIPALIDEGAARNPGLAVTTMDAFGADPRVVDLLAAQLRTAVAPAG